MHELALMKSMVDILDREVQDSEVGDVKTIHLEVGKLRYIVPEILVSCFEQIPKDKKLENAQIRMEVLPVKLSCKSCGEVSVPEENEFACMKCSSAEVNFDSGNEFRIKGIEW